MLAILSIPRECCQEYKNAAPIEQLPCETLYSTQQRSSIPCCAAYLPALFLLSSGLSPGPPSLLVDLVETLDRHLVFVRLVAQPAVSLGVERKLNTHTHIFRDESISTYFVVYINR